MIVFIGCTPNDPRHKRFGDYDFNLKDKTVTARERTKTKFVPNPLGFIVGETSWSKPFIPIE
jgi:hypothetical protein